MAGSVRKEETRWPEDGPGEKREAGKEGKKGKERNGGGGENRELVGLGRFVKIPRTTYKLHRSYRRPALKLMLQVVFVRCSRASSRATRRPQDRRREAGASRNSICRGTPCEARHENPLSLTSS